MEAVKADQPQHVTISATVAMATTVDALRAATVMSQVHPILLGPNDTVSSSVPQAGLGAARDSGSRGPMSRRNGGYSSHISET